MTLLKRFHSQLALLTVPGLTVVLAMPTLNLAHQLMAKVATVTTGVVTVRGGQIVAQIALTMATMVNGVRATTDGSGRN